MVHNDAEADTGPLYVHGARPADDQNETFVLVPVVGEPGVYYSVFSDGSYTRWIPRSARLED